MDNNQILSAADAARLNFIGLDSGASRCIAELQPLIERHLPVALDRFYEHLRHVPAVSRFFADPAHMAHAKARQITHWQSVAAGRFDGAYFDSSRRIGQVHARIGLEPTLYIGGYALIVESLVKAILIESLTPTRRGLFGGSKAPDAARLAACIAALMKAVLLDMDIAISTYFERVTAETSELNSRIAEVSRQAGAGDFTGRIATQATNPSLAELAGSVNHLLATVGVELGAASEALGGLADADLTTRLEGRRQGLFAELQQSINRVAAQMSDTVGRIKGTTGALKVATEEILSGANDLADRTTRQAATIEETTAAVEQISIAVENNAAGAAVASEKSRQVAMTATTGGDVMQRANAAMSAIKTSSDKISDIIGLIDDIAFQTNLLALNASVEAARAGDAGKGFAVVAVEVRRLAQSAAAASSQVKSLIDTSAGEVLNGSRLVGEAATHLSQIVDGAEESARLVEAIARASREQSAALSEVTQAIRQMDEMTQHNAALVEETNAAIEQTEGQARELDEVVATFRTEPPPRAVRRIA